MKIQLEMELNDAIAIVAAFGPSANNDFMKEKGTAALKRMERQVDKIVEGLDNSVEATIH